MYKQVHVIYDNTTQSNANPVLCPGKQENSIKIIGIFFWHVLVFTFVKKKDKTKQDFNHYDCCLLMKVKLYMAPYITLKSEIFDSHKITRGPQALTVT